ncbi:MAG: hypothetical protein Q8K46_00085 [Deltaproteobacteria bacterium]|nr:hypothetical protein [Deltaproteobacteria bacterium]
MATPITPSLSFERLVIIIGQAHAELAAQASRAVNAGITLRNWFIGCYIAEYEQQGTDRAHKDSSCYVGRGEGPQGGGGI